MSGTKEANTNSASVSDENSASLWRENVEPEPALKQKGKRAALSSLLSLLAEGDGAPLSASGRWPEPQGPLGFLTHTSPVPGSSSGLDVVRDPRSPFYISWGRAGWSPGGGTSLCWDQRPFWGNVAEPRRCWG